MNDLDLRDAARALRDEALPTTDGADATRMRILGTVRARRRRNVVLVRAATVLIAAAFGGVAWAAATGRLPSLATVLVRSSAADSVQAGAGANHDPPGAPESATGAAEPPANTAPAPVASEPAANTAPAPVASAPSANTAPGPKSGSLAPSRPEPAKVDEREPSSAVAQAPSAAASARPEVADGADALYQRAHTLHFQAGNWAAARAAWDAYLAAAPGGRYATFAHYNRALCLLRLGQIAEARRALSLFASGAFGGYRRAEAQSLLDALDAAKGAAR